MLHYHDAMFAQRWYKHVSAAAHMHTRWESVQLCLVHLISCGCGLMKYGGSLAVDGWCSDAGT